MSSKPSGSKSSYSEMIFIMNRKNRNLYKKMLIQQSTKDYTQIYQKERNSKVIKNDNDKLKNNSHKNKNTAVTSTVMTSTQYNTVLSQSKQTIMQSQCSSAFPHKKLELLPKSNYPFNNNEKRFLWQDLRQRDKILNLNDHYYKINRKICNDNLKGGFKEFLTRKKEICSTRHSCKKQKKSCEIYYKNHRNYKLNKSVGGDPEQEIKRIFSPDRYPFDKNDFKDTNIKYNFNMHKKRSSLSIKMFHSTDGSILSLINKTPMNVPIRRKKYFKNRSYQDSINLFDNNYAKAEPIRHPKGGLLYSRQFYQYDQLDKHLCFNKSMEEIRKEKLGEFRKSLNLFKTITNGSRIKNYNENLHNPAALRKHKNFSFDNKNMDHYIKNEYNSMNFYPIDTYNE